MVLPLLIRQNRLTDPGSGSGDRFRFREMGRLIRHLMVACGILVAGSLSPADAADEPPEAVASIVAEIKAMMETDLAGALNLADSALKEPGASDPAIEAELRIIAAAAARGLGDPERAQAEAERAVGLAEDLGDPELLASAFNEQVGATLALGRPDEALELAEETLRLRREIGDVSEIAKSLNNIGLIRARTGHYADALGYYLESLRLKEEIGDDHSAAGTLNNIAIVRFEMGDLEESEACLLRARSIFEKTNDLPGLADVLDNLGRVKREQGALDEALVLHLQSLEVERSLGRPEGIAISLNHIGRIYNRLGRYEEALQSSETALEINRSLGIPFGLAFSLFHVGVANFRLGRLDAASDALEEGIGFARRAGDPILLRDLHQYLAEVQAEQGQFTEAYLSLAETRRMDQQIFSYENANRMAELEAGLEIKQKDREIETLRLESELRQLTIDRSEQEIILLAQANRVSRLTRNSMIIAFAALAGFLLVLHSRYRLKKRAEEALREKNAEIIRQSGMVEAQGRKISDANRELHVTNMKLRELSRAVEQSPTGVLITDSSGTITYINPRFTEATGYTLDDVRGANPRIFKSGYHGKDFYRQLWSSIRTGRIWRGRFVNRRKDGSLYAEEATISPVINEVGEIFNFVAVMEFHLNPIEASSGENGTETLIRENIALLEEDVLPAVLQVLERTRASADGKGDAASDAALQEVVARLRHGVERLRSGNMGHSANGSHGEGGTDAPGTLLAHIVVDRKINGKVLSNLLVRLGCVVTVAEGPDDFVAVAGAIDLLVIDLDSERSSGPGLIRRVREDRKGSIHGRLRIICIENNGTGASGQWLEAEPDAIVKRPVTLEALRRECGLVWEQKTV